MKTQNDAKLLLNSMRSRSKISFDYLKCFAIVQNITKEKGGKKSERIIWIVIEPVPVYQSKNPISFLCSLFCSALLCYCRTWAIHSILYDFIPFSQRWFFRMFIFRCLSNILRSHNINIIERSTGTKSLWK